MDIEIMERKLRELLEWKAKVEPMLDEMFPAWETHVGRLSADELVEREEKAAEAERQRQENDAAAAAKAEADAAAANAAAGLEPAPMASGDAG